MKTAMKTAIKTAAKTAVIKTAGEKVRHVTVGKTTYRFKMSDRRIALIAGFEVWQRRKQYPATWIGLKILDTRLKGDRACRWRTFTSAYSAVERRMARSKGWIMLEEAYPEISERILDFLNSRYGEAD